MQRLRFTKAAAGADPSLTPLRSGVRDDTLAGKNALVYTIIENGGPEAERFPAEQKGECKKPDFLNFAGLSPIFTTFKKRGAFAFRGRFISSRHTLLQVNGSAAICGLTQASLRLQRGIQVVDSGCFVPVLHPHLREEMAKGKMFKVGDHVRWNSEAGLVSGVIIRKLTSNTRFKGYTHHASKEDPQYMIKSDKTDHIAIHKGSALHLLRDTSETGEKGRIA